MSDTARELALRHAADIKLDGRSVRQIGADSYVAGWNAALRDPEITATGCDGPLRRSCV